MGMMRWSLKAPAAAVAVAWLSGACTGLGPELGQAAPAPTTTVVADGGPGTLTRPRVAAPDPGRSRYVRDEWQPRLSDASPSLALIESTLRAGRCAGL